VAHTKKGDEGQWGEVWAEKLPDRTLFLDVCLGGRGVANVCISTPGETGEDRGSSLNFKKARGKHELVRKRPNGPRRAHREDAAIKQT